MVQLHRYLSSVVGLASMCLNHPEQVHKHACNDVDREGLVQSNHPELMTVIIRSAGPFITNIYKGHLAGVFPRRIPVNTCNGDIY